jgi:hypothetical protein
MAAPAGLHSVASAAATVLTEIRRAARRRAQISRVSDAKVESCTGPQSRSSANQVEAGSADALRRLAEDESIQRVTAAQLFESMGESASAALILLFAAPNVFPTPPGTSTILGAPLVLLALQLAIGSKARLPSVISRQAIAKAPLVSTMRRVAAWLGRGNGPCSRHKARLPGLAVRLTGASAQCWPCSCSFRSRSATSLLPSLSACAASESCGDDSRWIIAGWGVGLGAFALVSGVLYGLGTFLVDRI